MPHSGVDPLDAWLNDQLGLRVVARSPVGGGCIHNAWCLRGADGERFFAKTNRADQMPLLEAEANGLAALALVAPAGLVVPEPLALGQAGSLAVLVLPWLELARGQGRTRDWAACGANLARLHRTSLRRCDPQARPLAFGWDRDNAIGASPQHNGWEERWSHFFWERRLRPQLAWLASKGHRLRGAERLRERLPDWLDQHGAQPCLVHGDLWSGNGALLAGGGACFFDPAVYRGDREVDLAMARLFGGFPAAFFEGYGEEWPLAEGWRQRVDLYNLYHLLNHANLFGGGYHAQARSVLEALTGLG
jgi:fructosamine-3-kinase